MYIINYEVIVYHQQHRCCISSSCRNARWRVMKYNNAFAVVGDMHGCAVMICQTCGLDKKRTKRVLRSFLERITSDELTNS